MRTTYSLATATHKPSGDNAKSRIGNVQRTSILSNSFVRKEYKLTVPSSDPIMKKSFYGHPVSLTQLSRSQKTCRSHHRHIRVQTVIDIRRLSIRPRFVHSDHII